MFKHLFITLLLLVNVGCSSHFETTNQVNDLAFLQLEGNFLNTQLSVDGQAPILIDETTIKEASYNGKAIARFPMPVGKHTVMISRNGAVIVNRVIYVTNNNVFEVVVP